MNTKKQKHMDNKETNFLNDDELAQALQNCKTQEERDELMESQFSIRLGGIVWLVIFFVIVIIIGVVLVEIIN